MNLNEALADVATARRIEIDVRKLALASIAAARSIVMRELQAMPEQYRANAVILAEAAFEFADSDIESKFQEIADGLPSDWEIEERFDDDAMLTPGEARMQAAE